MDAQELIYLLEDAQFETRAEWEEFYEKARQLFEGLSDEDKEIVIEDNAFEMISMVISAYEYEDEDEQNHKRGEEQ